MKKQPLVLAVYDSPICNLECSSINTSISGKISRWKNIVEKHLGY